MPKEIKNWTTWFISDMHFGHDNVIDFCDRPFKDSIEMREIILENYNKLVSHDDLVIFVGDVFFYHNKEQMFDILTSMNGRKILVRGNHDQKPRQMMNAGFELCVDELVMTIANERVLISHYSFRMPKWKYHYFRIRNKILRAIGSKKRSWADKFHKRRPVNKGQFLLHGHTHTKEKVRDRMIHVGVDAWGFKPVNIQEISNIMDRIKQGEKDRGKWKWSKRLKKIKKWFKRLF